MFQIFIDAHYDFVGKRRWFYIASLGTVALAILSIVLHGGLNYGIDFTGGALVQVRYDRPANVGDGPSSPILTPTCEPVSFKFACEMPAMRI